MKQNLRKAEKEIRTENLNSKISQHLVQLISKLNSQNFVNGIKLGVYAPLVNEPLWWKSFTQSTVEQYLIVHTWEEQKLTYHKAEFDKITSGEYEVKLDSKILECEELADVILVPGLAFTKDFERLGRGRAYFDTYLKGFKGVKIGVFFSLQEVDSVYTEEHDEKLDYIITDKKILIRGI